MMKDGITVSKEDSLAEAREKIAKYLQDNLPNQDWDSQVIIIKDFYGRLEEVEHKKIMFDLLQEKYAISQVKFLEDLIHKLQTEADFAENITRSNLLLDFMLWQDDEDVQKLIWLDDKVKFSVIEPLTVLEVMLAFLDLNEQKIQLDVIKFLRKIQDSSAENKAKIYSNLVKVEVSKERNFSCKMAVSFLNMVKKYSKNEEILITLDVRISRRILSLQGVDVFNEVAEQDIPKVYAEFELAAEKILQKSGDYRYLNLSSLVKLLYLVANRDNYSPKDLCTQFIMRYHDKFTQDDKNYICEHLYSIFNLEAIAKSFTNQRESKIFNIVENFWCPKPDVWWQAMSKFSSVELVYDLFDLLFQSEFKEKIFFVDNIALYIGSNYLLYRSNLYFMKHYQNNREEISLRKISDSINRSKGITGDAFAVQKEFINYLRSKFQDKVKTRKIPELLDLDLGFFLYLARENNLDCFKKLLSFHVGGKHFPELFAKFEQKIASVRKKEAPHYAPFLELLKTATELKSSNLQLSEAEKRQIITDFSTNNVKEILQGGVQKQVEFKRIVDFVMTQEADRFAKEKESYLRSKQERESMICEDSLSSEVRTLLENPLYQQELAVKQKVIEEQKGRELAVTKQEYENKLFAQEEELRKLRELLQEKEKEAKELRDDYQNQTEYYNTLSSNVRQLRQDSETNEQLFKQQLRIAASKQIKVEEANAQTRAENAKLNSKVEKLTKQLNSLNSQKKKTSEDTPISFRQKLMASEHEKKSLADEKNNLASELTCLKEQMDSLVQEHTQALEENSKQLKQQADSNLREQKERSLSAQLLQNNTVNEVFTHLFILGVPYDNLAVFKAYYDIKSGAGYCPFLSGVAVGMPFYQEYSESYNFHHEQIQKRHNLGGDVYLQNGDRGFNSFGFGGA